ncbi:unnamed protein product [Acanthosepion pharaonis]|uniref:Uncharacterized protein n=1 Tax=Acanthosepion pharaonis TaxID=158019 RepID=A0A812DYY1_ACAPH|nr:unnamed protein product [Sepia pharaonis]
MIATFFLFYCSCFLPTFRFPPIFFFSSFILIFLSVNSFYFLFFFSSSSSSSISLFSSYSIISFSSSTSSSSVSTNLLSKFQVLLPSFLLLLFANINLSIILKLIKENPFLCVHFNVSLAIYCFFNNFLFFLIHPSFSLSVSSVYNFVFLPESSSSSYSTSLSLSASSLSFSLSISFSLSLSLHSLSFSLSSLINIFPTDIPFNIFLSIPPFLFSIFLFSVIFRKIICYLLYSLLC